MKKEYSRWTIQEKEGLVKLVTEYQDKGLVPDWRIVSERLGNKTVR